MPYSNSSRCMPILIFVRKVVILVCIKSALIMSFPPQTTNKTPLFNCENTNIISVDQPKYFTLLVGFKNTTENVGT